jgi:LPXTG-site transpeptidase (sortase) family protein
MIYKDSSKLSSIGKEIKKFLCFFIPIFIIVFIGLNFGTFYSNFKYNLSEIFPGKIKIIGEAAMIERVNSKPSNESIKYHQPDSILIPKINVNAPIVMPETTQQKDILLALKEGVALYPESALPGQKGRTVISGHSSPHLVYRGNYSTVFSLLNKLEKGDNITIYYNQKKYIYKVKNEYIFYAQEKILPTNIENKSMLVLLSCWPVGTDWKRIAIEAELVF